MEIQSIEGLTSGKILVPHQPLPTLMKTRPILLLAILPCLVHAAEPVIPQPADATPKPEAAAGRVRNVSTDTGGKTEVIAIDSEPGLKAFLDAYVAANNAKDIKKLKAMRHPKDLAAWSAFLEKQPASPGQTKPTLEQSLLKEPIPADHPPFVVLRFLKDSPLPFKGMVDWPIPPTHEVQLDYSTGPNSLTGHVIELAKVGKDWFIVTGAPSAEFIKKMTSGKAP